jgi:predicted transcriptional regulator
VEDEKNSQYDSKLELTAAIVSAYVSKNSVPMASLAELVSSVHSSLDKLTLKPEPPQQPPTPAVPIRRSVTPDYIISLEDGRKFKSLKRHLATHYDMTPEQYRQKWSLPPDYPMVAPNYAATRSALARTMGLGRKSQSAPPEPEVPVEAPPAPKRRGRKPKAVE